MRLENKIAMVTGSGRGIGKAIALKMAKEGADIVLIDVNEGDLDETAGEVTKFGRRALPLCMDITDEDNILKMAAEITKTFGRLDILVNNAGITRDRNFIKLTLDQWQKVIDVNLTGTFLCSQMAAKMMKENAYGKIINITSLSGQIGNYGQSNYAASKAGVIGFTKTIALELAKFGINVNAIAPGFISTPMSDEIPKPVLEKMISNIPLGRAGSPDDIANLTVFLASEEAAYITGQIIACNGGNHM